MLVVIAGCNPASNRTAGPERIQFGAMSPTGDWRLGGRLLDGRLPIEQLAGGSSYLLDLPREWDLKFVGWGPEPVQGDEVIWVYSADIGPLLYAVSGDGVVRLPCPPELVPPAEWPGKAWLPCEAR